MNFKVDDKVTLIHADGVFTLEKNKSYTVSGFARHDTSYITILEDTSDSIYNPKRFIIDIKKSRKDKLKEIMNNQI